MGGIIVMKCLFARLCAPRIRLACRAIVPLARYARHVRLIAGDYAERNTVAHHRSNFGLYSQSSKLYEEKYCVNKEFFIENTVVFLTILPRSTQ